MADCVFTIANLLYAKVITCTLNIPPMKTNDQFTQSELTITQRIATLWIHAGLDVSRI